MTKEEEKVLKERLAQAENVKAEIDSIRQIRDVVVDATVSVRNGSAACGQWTEYGRVLERMCRIPEIEKAIKGAIIQVLNRLEKQYAEI